MSSGTQNKLATDDTVHDTTADCPPPGASVYCAVALALPYPYSPWKKKALCSSAVLTVSYVIIQ